MMLTRRARVFTSALASGCLVLAIGLTGGGKPTSEWVFPGLLMLLNGWGTMFNLLTLWSGCEAEAVTVNIPNDGDEPDRPMSPRLTTVTLAIFWLTGAVVLATVSQ